MLLRSIFVAVTVNTGVIFALANFSPLTGHGYAHFSRGWYDEIGAPIALTMMVDVLSFPFETFCWRVVRWVRLWLCSISLQHLHCSA